MTYRSLVHGALGLTLMAGSAVAHAQAGAYFERVATYPVYENLGSDADTRTETAAEIITATDDGRTLVYTDSPGEAVGFIDLSDPARPRGDGRIALDGEPTSTAVAGAYALVAVNTSGSFTEPDGHLAAISLETREVTTTCALGGQPDSVTVSPDGRYAAVALENERNEAYRGGALPQLPAGELAVFELGSDGTPANCDSVHRVDLAGLAAVAPTDPEPEFVDINAANEAVVTLQENNHLVIVDLESREIVNDFSAGTAGLADVDANGDGVIAGVNAPAGLRREPDAVRWLDNERFVTADEGDYRGGSRGFTVFRRDGTVAHTAGARMEHLAMRTGHYSLARAAKKGVEPEGVEIASFGDERLVFVNAERANFVGVYRDNGPDTAPTYRQMLPTNVGPEGSVAIPERGLLVVATEEDMPEEGVRATVQVFERSADRPAYPMLVAETDDATGTPIGWGPCPAWSPTPAIPARPTP